MAKMTKIGASVLLLATAFASTAQAGHRNPIDQQSNPQAKDFTDKHIAPSELARPFERDAVVTDPKIFANVTIGQAKDDVSAILGEALTQKKREWDYQFKFMLPNSENYLICQYKVRFDRDNLVKSTAWRRRQCENLAKS